MYLKAGDHKILLKLNGEKAGVVLKFKGNPTTLHVVDSQIPYLTVGLPFSISKTCLLTIIIKDGAYYCYCAYVLRISRYSGFLSVLLTSTGIFLHGLKLSGESRS